MVPGEVLEAPGEEPDPELDRRAEPVGGVPEPLALTCQIGRFPEYFVFSLTYAHVKVMNVSAASAIEIMLAPISDTVNEHYLGLKYAKPKTPIK